jgi:hypothetical protein
MLTTPSSWTNSQNILGSDSRAIFVYAGHENSLHHPQLSGDEKLPTPDSELQGR